MDATALDHPARYGLYFVTMKATLLSLIALGLIALATSSCSTAQGFGEDLQTLGRGIQRAAE